MSSTDNGEDLLEADVTLQSLRNIESRCHRFDPANQRLVLILTENGVARLTASNVLRKRIATDQGNLHESDYARMQRRSSSATYRPTT